MTATSSMKRAASASLLLCFLSPAAFAAEFAPKQSDESSLEEEYFVPTITKIEGFGGSLTEGWPGVKWRPQGGVIGTIAVPLAEHWAVQTDGMLSMQNDALVTNVTGHVYWYDPKKGLAGFYTSGEWRSTSGGEGLLQLGGEGEIYHDRFTLGLIAGAETQARGQRGNIFDNGYDGRYGYAFGWDSGYGYGFGAMDGKGGLYETDNFRPNFFDQTRFFDHLEIGYYPIDDLKLTVAHEYTGGFNSAVFDVEYLFRTGTGTAPAFFAEGAIGDHGQASILAGVRFYFGEEDKSLIRRQREDDPTTHARRGLRSLANLHSQHGQPMIPVPISSSP
ncbi:MAG TPA: hypothetical protein VED87_07425 [Methylocystis sp.]|nr:hypothetical protein [Methylocystis sp.]